MQSPRKKGHVNQWMFEAKWQMENNPKSNANFDSFEFSHVEQCPFSKTKLKKKGKT